MSVRLWDAPKPTGYRVGPVLGDGPPFGLLWEGHPATDDGHPHRWETVLLGGEGTNRRVEEVVRCAVCLSPRCSSSTDRNPCMLRRHHRGDHHPLFAAGAPT